MCDLITTFESVVPRAYRDFVTAAILDYRFSPHQEAWDVTMLYIKFDTHRYSGFGEKDVWNNSLRIELQFAIKYINRLLQSLRPLRV